jgi:hypothetical protein
VVNYLKVHQLLGGFLDLENSGIAELEHLFAISTYEVIVLPVLVRLFELRHVLAELVPDHQSSIH